MRRMTLPLCQTANHSPTDYYVSLPCVNVTLSTKPEVHNTLQRHQRSETQM